MQLRERIILFAYMYIGGVAFSYANPQSQNYNHYYYIALTLFGGAWAFVTLARRRGARLPQSFFYVFMILTAMTFGMLRYNQDYSVTDDPVGTITVTASAATVAIPHPVAELHQYRLQKLTATAAPVTVTVSGTRNGHTVTAAPVEIAPADPVGQSYDLDEPFESINDVRGQGADATLALIAVSNHLSRFTSTDPTSAPWEIEGNINIDPDLFADKAKIQLEVETIRPPGADYAFRCTGGSVVATIKPAHPLYAEITQLESYGWRVKFTGPLLAPMLLNNPGGFDYQRYLNNTGIYATMNLFPPRPPFGDEPPEPDSLVVVERADGNPIIELSLWVKDRMLRVFKQTVPFPESAFLGGVTLGMRYGLSSVQTPFDGTDDFSLWGKRQLARVGLPRLKGLFDGTHLTIPSEFQWAGINHVLAVSGLHVSIITIMFWGIFTLLRVPPKVYAPLIVLALIIFSIITGYRPSTQRAALMNSIAVLSTVYMGKGLRSGILFTIPISGLIVLLFQPLLIVEPSLVLSYFAVLSLGLISTPVMRVLARLRGFSFVGFLLLIAAWTAVGMLHWSLCASAAFWLPFLAAAVFLMALARRLNERFPTFTWGFADLNPWVFGFFAAQFGIQFGMMIPLSSYYFGRWPLAGAYANFAAIPLIGIIVQLAMMAGIFAIVLPVFGLGMNIALLIGATNYFLCVMFEAIGHYSVLLFPYPYLTRLHFGQILFYFMLIAAFIWHEWLIVRVRSWRLTARADRGFAARFYALAAAVALGLLAWFGSFFAAPNRDLEMTVAAVRYGQSILLEAPDRSDILIGGGSFDKEAGFDNGNRTLMPMLGRKQIRHLDWLVANTLHLEDFAGLHTVLDNIWADRVLLPFDPAAITRETTYDEFLTAVGGPTLARQAMLKENETLYREVVSGFPDRFLPSLLQVLAKRGPTLWNRWAGWTVEPVPGTGGLVLREATIRGIPYRVEVVSPTRPFSEDPLANNSLVLRVGYGSTAFLLTGDVAEAGLIALLGRPREQVRAQVLVFPRHGTIELAPGLFDRLLKTVAPEYVIFSYSRDRALAPAQIEAFDRNWAACVERLGASKCLRTDRAGAVIVTSDGTTVTVDSMARRQHLKEVAVSDDAATVMDTW